MPYIRSGNPKQIIDWEKERFWLRVTNSISYICQYSGDQHFSQCQHCNEGDRCKAYVPNYDKPIIKVYNLEFISDYRDILKYVYRTRVLRESNGK